ncbi:penicillin acylase family protein [Frigoriglobus tundricola]|uniref:penicillin acylase family protein n=1 Tax=Frigoriglobus tundricola TaxID=2774151 RepID=UPI00148ED7D3|nr:penicillin acylase family protein [Frigoriglobus tundricola]
MLLRLVLGRRLPVASGELRLRGPVAPITVRRDKWGVPHIDAGSDADAHFAVGFCQGQDRAGQLEVLWRLTRGRLAEWVGPVALVADRASRRIGFRRAAEAQLEVLSPDARVAFEAFARGVTAGAAVGLTQKSHEFAIVGGTPAAWDAADVLGVLKLQSFLLPSNWDVELARLRIVLADGADAMIALDPVGSEGAFAGSPSLSGGGRGEGSSVGLATALDQLTADLAALQAHLPRGGGSNNWAVAGTRTASGKPLLASDPHLAPTCPPPWYLAHVRTPQWEVAGAGLAGAPGFPIGHNGFAAWGVTAGLTDNSDFFVETLGPDGHSVRQPDGTFAPCQVVREVISVKGQPDVIEDVLVTPRGPILTPVIPDVSLALSLSAIWLDPRPVIGFLKTPTARSFDEFRNHFAAWPALPLNVLYADAGGTIGWQLVGEVPTRRGGHGLLPRPADIPDSGWTGTVPFEAMPFAVNPACGYLATANNAPYQWAVDSEQWAENNPSTATRERRPGDPFSPSSDSAHSPPPTAHLGRDFIDEYRVRRIRECLAARDADWAPADLAALQLDVQSIPWREMRDRVLALAPTDPDARDARALLAAWDGRVDSESTAAAVFEVFVAEMCVRVARVKAPTAWPAALGEGGLGVAATNLFADRRVSHLIGLLRAQSSGWFASWPREMESALAVAVRTLRKVAGPGPAYWAWGHLRQLRLEHPLFGKHRWLGPAFNRGPVPCGGDANTVSQAGARPTNPTDFTHNMANLRTVFDLADLARSTFVMCGGQSGNPLSPHHADQLPLWQQGESFTLPWDQADVIRAAVDTLRLLPG